MRVGKIKGYLCQLFTVTNTVVYECDWVFYGKYSSRGVSFIPHTTFSFKGET